MHYIVKQICIKPKVIEIWMQKSKTLDGATAKTLPSETLIKR